MKQCTCNVCLTEFTTESASTCPKCGSSDIAVTEEKENTPQPSPDDAGRENEAEVKAILGQLCIDSYDCAYRGTEWQESINRAVERLRPFLKSEKVSV